MTTSDATQARRRKYPTLTDDEVATIYDLDDQIAVLDAEQQRIADARSALRDQRSALLEAAALRAVTPEEVSLVFRTTGKGHDDLKNIVAEQHPYITGFGIFGPYEQERVLGTTIDLCRGSNDPAEIPALAAALCSTAALIAPDGGLSYEIDPTTGNTIAPSHHVDHVWWEHADGMHPVEVIEDDLNEHRSFLLAHSADGTRAVLMERYNYWRYASNGHPRNIVAIGDLTEVLTVLFREVGENRPSRYCDDDH